MYNLTIKHLFCFWNRRKKDQR